MEPRFALSALAGGSRGDTVFSVRLFCVKSSFASWEVAREAHLGRSFASPPPQPPAAAPATSP